jgi:hypothetical protein
MFGGIGAMCLSGCEQPLPLLHHASQVDVRSRSSDQSCGAIQISFCNGLDRVVQHSGSELGDDRLEQAKACWADVDSAPAVGDEIAMHVEEIAGNGELHALAVARKSLFEVFEMVAGIDPRFEGSTVASENAAGASKPSCLSDETTQLGDSGPADQIEVNFVEQ